MLGRAEEYRLLAAASEAIFTEVGDARSSGQVVQERAFYEAVLGDYPKAIREGERALGIAREVDDRSLEMRASLVLAVVLVEYQYLQGARDPAMLSRARQLLDAALDWVRVEGTSVERLAFESNAGVVIDCSVSRREHSSCCSSRSVALPTTAFRGGSCTRRFAGSGSWPWFWASFGTASGSLLSGSRRSNRKDSRVSRSTRGYFSKPRLLLATRSATTASSRRGWKVSSSRATRRSRSRSA